MNNAVVLILIMFLTACGGKIFGKASSSLVLDGALSKLALYCAFNGAVSCVVFWFLGGFKLNINLPTAIFSAVYALLAGVSAFTLVGYKLVNVSTLTIITSTCSIVSTSFLGAFVFKENISTASLIRIGVMVAAVMLSFFDKAKDKQKEKQKGSIWLLVIVILLSLAVDAGVAITTKLYTLDSRVADENSFFFFTNVFLLFFSLILFSLDSLKNRENFKSALEMLNPKRALILVGNTVCSNVGSLVGILLIAIIDVSVYSPLVSALGIISGVAASLIFRQRLGALSYLAALLACAAMFI